jgi:hypothetical protein
VLAALQGLATNRIAGQELLTRMYDGPRPLQASLVAAAVDQNALYPNNRYGSALDQVDRIQITTNYHDRTLRLYTLLARRPTDAMGTVGVPAKWLLGPNRFKIAQTAMTPYVGKSHRWKQYAKSPGAAAELRPFFFYWQPMITP